MVAPIAGLFAGFGLLAGRSLFQMRMQRQRDEAFEGALGSLFGVGQEQLPDLAPGQEGPPRPAAIGSTLTEQQQGALQALSVADPELALKMGLGFQQQNLNQQAAAENRAMQQAGMQLQRDRFQLDTERHDLSVARFIQENNARLADAQEAARVFADPAFSLRKAIEGGSEQYVIGNTPDGVPTLAAVPGSDQFVTMERTMLESTNTLNRLNEIGELTRQFWQEGSDPNSPIVRRIQSLVSQVQLDIKDSEFNLGALTGEDARFLEAIMSDPTTFVEQATSSPGAVAQGLSGLQQRIGSRSAQLFNRTSQWLGTDEALRENTQQALARTAQSVEAAGAAVEAEAARIEQEREGEQDASYLDAVIDRVPGGGRALLRRLIEGPSEVLGLFR